MKDFVCYENARDTHIQVTKCRLFGVGKSPEPCTKIAAHFQHPVEGQKLQSGVSESLFFRSSRSSSATLSRTFRQADRYGWLWSCSKNFVRTEALIRSPFDLRHPFILQSRIGESLFVSKSLLLTASGTTQLSNYAPSNILDELYALSENLKSGGTPSVRYF